MEDNPTSAQIPAPAQPPAEGYQPKEWYKKTIVIVVFLLFLFPVGLFFMWKWALWSNLVKWIITIVGIISVTLNVIGTAI